MQDNNVNWKEVWQEFTI